MVELKSATNEFNPRPHQKKKKYPEQNETEDENEK